MLLAEFRKLLAISVSVMDDGLASCQIYQYSGGFRVGSISALWRYGAKLSVAKAMVAELNGAFRRE
jgi:hypothetical protein